MIGPIQAAVPGASVRQICAVLGISRSWYYAVQAAPAPQTDAKIAAWIAPIVQRFPGYGYRRITQTLRRDGVVINHKRVQRIVRQQGLIGQVRRVVRTRPPGDWPQATNRVAGVRPTGPNQIWMADLTYLHLRRETGFVACILDAWSRRCVGWAIGPNLTAELATQALEQAIAQRQPAPGLIHHSDQGVQYLSRSYQAILQRIGAEVSLSAPGRPTDNALIERFFRTLKDEEVYLNAYRDLAEAERQIGYFIEQLYNEERLHSRLGYVPPAEFETVVELESSILSP
jgi:transposase InsO family protein